MILRAGGGMKILRGLMSEIGWILEGFAFLVDKLAYSQLIFLGWDESFYEGTKK